MRPDDMPVNSFRDAPLITVTKTESVSATPQKVAEMFLAMDSVQQADFFDALGKLVQEEYSRNKKLYAFGEMQWCYMAGELKQRQGVGLLSPHQPIGAGGAERSA